MPLLSQHFLYNELSLLIIASRLSNGKLCQAIMQRPGAIGARLALLVLLTGLSPLCCQLSQSSVSSSLHTGSLRFTFCDQGITQGFDMALSHMALSQA